MKIENIVDAMREKVDGTKKRSAWDRGVIAYAHDILDTVENAGYIPETKEELIDAMLNGAHEDRKRNADIFDHWSVASWGGSYLAYDGDIAKRLCSPSELKKCRNGERKPNFREEWLDVQTRALYQAGRRIIDAFVEIMEAAEREERETETVA